jgi:hypothetical protein
MIVEDVEAYQSSVSLYEVQREHQVQRSTDVEIRSPTLVGPLGENQFEDTPADKERSVVSGQ